MEDSNKVTKGQLLEMIRKEIIFQEKKELLENKILSINNELYVLTEGKEGKKKKEDDIDEGLFQNIGRGIAGALSGTKGVGQAAAQKVQQAGQKVAQNVQQAGQKVAQKYQSGADQKKLQYINSDIQKKQAELNDLKKQYTALTGQRHSTKGSQDANALARDQQSKGMSKKQKTNPPSEQIGKKVQAQPLKNMAENKKK
jgi:hypothetical protein